VVRLNAQGDFVSERVITAADSHQYDEKDHRTYPSYQKNPDVCVGGDYRHSHQSVVETNLPPNWNWGNGRYPTFSAMQPPTKRSDGTWVIRGVYPEWMDTCLSTEQFANCYIHRPPSISTGSCDNILGMIGGAPPGTFDLEATDPEGDFFSKQINYQIPDGYLRPPGKSKLNVSWTITARRIGKCLVGDSIPITDDYPNHPNLDINDEDVEMGVEHDSDSIDPDSGVAALNLRMTCDQVPIKNARVKVRVVALAGGHLHKNNFLGRPYGSLKWNGVEKRLTDDKPSIEVKTDDDGRAHLTFKAGKAMNHDNVGIAGIYRITATSMRFPMRRAEVRVEAKVDGLSPIDADSNLVDDVRGASHTSGDNATAPTKSKLVQFAKDFHDAQDKHNREDLGACPWPNYPLWVVDVSLPTGGLYDIDDDWATPHQTHGVGDGVDFSVKERSDSPSSATKWPPASATTGSNSRWVGAKFGLPP
jgi:hypothetical protein